ncbi:MAG: IPExxxVDY family protein [Bacteroidota bacterium]
MPDEKQIFRKLDFDQDLDFLLIGILSGSKDFKLCFEINRLFRLDLTRLDDLSISTGRPGSTTRHARFVSMKKHLERYYLVSNRDTDNTGSFIPEMRNVDYFLAISGMAANFELKKMVDGLRSLPVVSGAFEIDPAGLKSAETFFCLLEN